MKRKMKEVIYRSLKEYVAKLTHRIETWTPEDQLEEELKELDLAYEALEYFEKKLNKQEVI